MNEVEQETAQDCAKESSIENIGRQKKYNSTI